MPYARSYQSKKLHDGIAQLVEILEYSKISTIYEFDSLESFFFPPKKKKSSFRVIC